MNEAEFFLIDTNILVYAYDKTDEQKHRLARSLLEKCWKRERSYAISAQNLAEFFIIVTKKVPHPLTVEEAEQIIADITHFPSWLVLHYTKDTLLRAVVLYKKRKKQWWDTVIAATMQEAGVSFLYTENEKDFESFEGITAVNPFT